MFDLVFGNQASVFFQCLLDSAGTLKGILLRHLPLENKPVPTAAVYGEGTNSVDLFPGKGPKLLLTRKTCDPILIHSYSVRKRIKNKQKGKNHFQDARIWQQLSRNPGRQKEHQCKQNQAKYAQRIATLSKSVKRHKKPPYIFCTVNFVPIRKVY